MGRHIALLVVHTSALGNRDEARNLVRLIRDTHPPVEGRLLVTGHTAFDIDFLALVRAHAPRAVALIVAATYVVLFVLLGSILLPAKAVLMNFLSISASYGALVWIFRTDTWRVGCASPRPDRDRHAAGHVLRDFWSLDLRRAAAVPDSRGYLRTNDNTQAVGVGLERTGRLITAAAAIMAAIFFGFAMADLW
jgi:RND superfamily putative drug exporter